MKSLYEILVKEGENSPKALILAGAPGAGKGYVLKGLDLKGLKVLNLDNYLIDLLKKANVSLDLKRADADSRSKYAHAMRGATANSKQEQDNVIENRESFILDGTSASYKNTVALKDRLEDIGYDVFMLYVYTDLENSLKQNQNRFDKSKGEDRSLPPAIVMRTWEKVTKNYIEYKELFGDNFVSVSNSLSDDSMKDLVLIAKTYLEPFKPQNTKPKDEKAKIRSAKAKEKLETSLKNLLSSEYTQAIINGSSSKEEAQSKINNFLS